jgi:exopolysaccharide/PEP-CTERM locus tyrosine autokinase
MLLITSSISCEGKSITAINLAVTLAQEYDHTVLLVDADLRKPSLNDYLGIEQQAGLSECLLEGLEIKDALLQTGIGKLSLLPAGGEVHNPAEVFSSQKARDLFLELKYRYPDRYIIIDSPPVLPFAETRSLSSIADGVLLVVKEGTVPLRHINETLDCLKGANMLGIVYNQATVETQDEHDHYYRYYRRSYADAI